MRRGNGRDGWAGRRRRSAGTPGIGNGPLVRRWIGARRRRASREGRDARGEGAEIIVLTWAQTFGRGTAATPDPARDPHFGGAEPPVVEFGGEGRPGS
ncbi:hypothetical protein DK419_02625 [Methylobacterium terrae]|uniref:Uncharacterized protein n=1 Tax=Methylobacterium terrae TaxID=2202827 RepID=A0A2U8WH19_9HYPH|nr:hypothetical protein [Methylobacterium terrae]AWN45349.1 hypothetical protein DK419_02625 [Methylobacterium terrae]